MPNEIISNEPSHEPGDLLRPYSADDPAPEAPVADPEVTVEDNGVPEPDAQEAAPEPTLPPDLEEMKKNLLRDYHGKTTKLAEQLRAVAAEKQTIAQREAALQERLSTYDALDRFDREVLANDPELRAVVEERIASARGKVGRPATDDRVLAEIASMRQALAETHIQQVETTMSARPDWTEAYPKMLDLFSQTGMLANAQNPQQLKALYEVAYAAVTASKRGAAAEAVAQRKLVDQVKQAQTAARLGKGNAPPASASTDEPSSFGEDGRLRSWTEIASDQRERARLNR